MPQRDLLLPWLTAIDNAALALRAKGIKREPARAQAAPWLERFGLAGFERTRPAELSGGMRQRVSFLRSLLAGKPVLALDEPFAALDAITRVEMQGWLAHVLATEPRTVVLVTHDVEEAVMLGDRVIVMSARPGRVVAEIDNRPPPAAAAHGPGDRRPARTGAARARGPGMRRLLSGWRPLLVVLVLLGIWELYVDLGGADPLILPAPHAIAQSLCDDRSLLWSNFLVTAQEVLLGILVAAVAALLLATAMHFFVTVRRSIYPLLIASQTIPIPMLAPVLILWLGFGILPKLVVIALVSFFSIVVTTLAGFASVDPELLKLMRTFDAPRRRVFWSIELPTALPGVFTGAKIAVIVAVIGAVFAEQAGASSGLGYLFEQSIPQLLTARAYAAVVVLSAFAILLFAVLTLAERLATPWAHQTEVTTDETTTDRAGRGAARRAGADRLRGEEGRAGARRPKHPQSLSVMLDWTPNADHVGIYEGIADGAFKAAGLNVSVRVPPNPAAPLSLLQAGKVDVAITYEPQLMLARDKGATLVAFGALVQRPLTSIVSLGKKHITSVKQLQGKTVGDAGIPYQQAYLKTVLQHAGRSRRRRSSRSTSATTWSARCCRAGSTPTLGAYWNYEAIQLARRTASGRT